jgi:signal transduction histidine kinase
MCEFIEVFDLDDYNKLFDIITIGICVIKPETNNVIYINNYLLELLQLDKENVFNSSILDIQYIHKIYKKYEFKLNKQTSFEINLRYPTKERLNLKVSYLINKEHLIFFITDITTIKNYQRQLYDNNKALYRTNNELKESNKLLEEMAYMMAHDLRSPIRTISGYVQKLINAINTDYTLNDVMLLYSNFILESTTYVNKLIDGLLMYSNINTKNLITENVNVNDCIKCSLDKIVKCKSIIVNNEIADIIKVKVNTQLFIKVLMNLFENALKFNNKKQKIITIKYDPNSYILSIIDNGNGIELEYLDKIFKLFYQLDNDIKGIGLGLSVVQRILNIHNCYIYIKSELNVGSEFCINIKNVIINE